MRHLQHQRCPNCDFVGNTEQQALQHFLRHHGDGMLKGSDIEIQRAVFRSLTAEQSPFVPASPAAASPPLPPPRELASRPRRRAAAARCSDDDDDDDNFVVADDDDVVDDDNDDDDFEKLPVKSRKRKRTSAIVDDDAAADGDDKDGDYVLPGSRTRAAKKKKEPAARPGSARDLQQPKLAFFKQESSGLEKGHKPAPGAASARVPRVAPVFIWAAVEPEAHPLVARRAAPLARPSRANDAQTPLHLFLRQIHSLFDSNPGHAPHAEMAQLFATFAPTAVVTRPLPSMQKTAADAGFVRPPPAQCPNHPRPAAPSTVPRPRAPSPFVVHESDPAPLPSAARPAPQSLILDDPETDRPGAGAGVHSDGEVRLLHQHKSPAPAPEPPTQWLNKTTAAAARERPPLSRKRKSNAPIPVDSPPKSKRRPEDSFICPMCNQADFPSQQVFEEHVSQCMEEDDAKKARLFA